MISLLIGKPYVELNKLTVLVGGVGYEVYTGNKILSQAATLSEITLFIHTHVREDALELFGFSSATERNLFLLLLSVSGIGPKTALMIANQGVEQITTAVQQANVTFFTKIPRVGKKMGQKIIIDLKSRLGSLKELKIGGFSEHEQMIVDAVVALGFDEQRVYELMEGQAFSEVSAEDAIKKLLKELK
jgi:Holliday junction DNA helicase RuvA